VHWVRRFILFCGKRHPATLGETEVTRFLNHLAVDRQVAAATQDQALSALLFLYREVLKSDLPWLDGLTRPKKPVRLPVVLTPSMRSGRCSPSSPAFRGWSPVCSTVRDCGCWKRCDCG